MKKIIVILLFVATIAALTATNITTPTYAGEQINHGGHCAGMGMPFGQCAIWSCERTWRVGDYCGSCEKVGHWWSCRL